jgi:hypothetical protein
MQPLMVVRRDSPTKSGGPSLNGAGTGELDELMTALLIFVMSHSGMEVLSLSCLATLQTIAHLALMVSTQCLDLVRSYHEY